MKKHRGRLLLVVFVMLAGVVFTACSRDPAACRHKYGPFSVDREATCSELGRGSRICRRCGFTEVQEIPTLAHDVVHVPEVAATCTESGFTSHEYCASCGTVFVPGAETEATGHTVRVVTPAVPATCTEQGYTEESWCAVCGLSLSARERVYALGHTAEIDKAVPATCFEPGLTEGRHCSRCGEVLHAQTAVESTGHNYLSGVCTRCGHGSDSASVPEIWNGDYENADFLDVRRYGIGSTQWDGSLPLSVTGEKLTIGLLGNNNLLVRPETNDFTVWLEEQTGIKLDFYIFMGAQADVTVQLRLMMNMGLDLPDIIPALSFHPQERGQMVNSGYLVNLAGYFITDSYYLAQAMDLACVGDEAQRQLLMDAICQAAADPASQRVFGTPDIVVGAQNTVACNWSVTANCKNPRLAFRFLDFLYSPEASLRQYYGKYDVDWSWIEDLDYLDPIGNGHLGGDARIVLYTDSQRKNSRWFAPYNTFRDEKNFQIYTGVL